ncbi:hypothetical protein QBC43DRAFT_317531 [Cladorrhinum sp. PSN259]|nr:hypothetical protein QBC43DRAFT_317531 [Cladorrhinum sp. PSN259]
MPTHKAPSAGQKVTPSDAPTIHESAGKVEDSSLAAESIRSGGAFSENPESKFKGTPAKQSSSLRGSGSGSSESESNANVEPGVGGAPLDTQSAAPPGSKPHGKNLKEGGFAGTGTGEGALPEPGSDQDPGRKGVEKGIGKGMGMGSGNKIAGENMFGGLGSEESA